MLKSQVRNGWGLMLSTVLSIACCNEAGSTCAEKMADQEWEGARRACSREYFKDFDPETGLELTRALVRLGEYSRAVPLGSFIAPELNTPIAYLVLADAAKRADMLEVSKDAAAKVLELSIEGGDLSMLGRGAKQAAIALLSGDELTVAQIYLETSNWIFDLLAVAPALQAEVADRNGRDRLDTLQLRASLFYKRGLLKESADVLAEFAEKITAEDLDTQNYYLVWYHLQLGILRADEERWIPGRDALKESIRLIEKGPALHADAKQAVHLNFAFLSRGEAREKQEEGKPQDADRLRGEALGELEQAEQSGSEKSDVYLQRGILLFDRGQYPAAIAKLEHAAENTNQSKLLQEIYYNLGKAKEKDGDFVGAMESYREGSQHVSVLRERAKQYSADVVASHSLPFARRFGLYADKQEWESSLSVIVELDWLSSMPEEVNAISEEPPSVKAMLKAWDGRRLLLFFSDEEHLWRLDVRGQQVTGAQVGPIKGLEELAEKFDASPGDEKLARELGSRLLPPVERTEEVVEIWAMGKLGEMPWAALRRGEELAIERTPLARVVTLRSFPARNTSQSSFVVLGDFDINSELPKAKEEAIAVAKSLGVEPLLGPAATRGKFFAASDASGLYLSGHAKPSPLLGPFLPIHDENRPEDRDGGISEREIRLRKVGPRVVVLSSCMGSDATDDFGWKSLTGAFIEAGSRAVIASPRSVLDDQTQKLSSFLNFDLLKSDPVRALAKAQLAAVKAKIPTEDWSAFTVFLAAP